MAISFVSRNILCEHLYKYMIQYNGWISIWNEEQTDINKKIDPNILKTPLNFEKLLENILVNEKKINFGRDQNDNIIELKESELKQLNHDQEIACENVAKMFLDSFRDFNDNEISQIEEKQRQNNTNGNNTMLPPLPKSKCQKLKSKSIILFKDPSCLFFRHLQIASVWNHWTIEEKNNFWKWLNGVYLIVQIFHILPATTLIQLQNIIRGLYQSCMVEKQQFNKAQFLEDSKKIIHNLKIDEVTKMTNYFWEFVLSEDTPIFDLMPIKYHDHLKIGLDIVQSDLGRKMLLSQMQPVLKNFEKKLEGSGITVSQEDGTLNIVANDSNNEDEERAKKEHLLVSVVEVVASVLEEHDDVVQEILSNPSNGLFVFGREFGPKIIDFMKTWTLKKIADGVQGKVKSEETLKKERQEKEDRFLPGMGVLKRR